MPLPEKRSGIFVFVGGEIPSSRKLFSRRNIFSPISSTMHKIVFNFD
jgi:hypothetical protein